MDLTNEQYEKIDKMSKQLNAPLSICKDFLSEVSYDYNLAILNFKKLNN